MSLWLNVKYFRLVDLFINFPLGGYITWQAGSSRITHNHPGKPLKDNSTECRFQLSKQFHMKIKIKEFDILLFYVNSSSLWLWRPSCFASERVNTILKENRPSIISWSFYGPMWNHVLLWRPSLVGGWDHPP